MGVFLVKSWCLWDPYAPPFVVTVATNAEEAAAIIAELKRRDEINDCTEVDYTADEIRTAAEILADDE